MGGGNGVLRLKQRGDVTEAQPALDHMIWLRPERNTAVNEHYLQEGLFDRTRARGREVGLDVVIAPVDSMHIVDTEQSTEVYLNRSAVDPLQTFFHTKLMTFPEYQGDIWRHLAFTANLEEAGFFTTVSSTQNILVNDKTLLARRARQLGIPILPSVRLDTQHFFGLFDKTIDLEFPFVVKPTSWGGGHGVMLVHDTADLLAVLQVAGGGDTTMLLQPWLGEGTSDLRLYLSGRSVVQAWARRPSKPGVTVSNYVQGGLYEQVEPPPQVCNAAQTMAETIGAHYCCVDFLQNGDEWYFSEAELDGGAVGYRADLERLRLSSWKEAFGNFRRERMHDAP